MQRGRHDDDIGEEIAEAVHSDSGSSDDDVHDVNDEIAEEVLEALPDDDGGDGDLSVLLPANCAKCYMAIKVGTGYKAAGGSWHDHCFNCLFPTCAKKLSMKKHVAVEDKIYCKKHAPLMIPRQPAKSEQPLAASQTQLPHPYEVNATPAESQQFKSTTSALPPPPAVSGSGGGIAPVNDAQAAAWAKAQALIELLSNEQKQKSSIPAPTAASPKGRPRPGGSKAARPLQDDPFNEPRGHESKSNGSAPGGNKTVRSVGVKSTASRATKPPLVHSASAASTTHRSTVATSRSAPATTTRARSSVPAAASPAAHRIPPVTQAHGTSVPPASQFHVQPPPPAAKRKCDVCIDQVATVSCMVCRACFCSQDCFHAIHRVGVLKLHRPVALHTERRSQPAVVPVKSRIPSTGDARAGRHPNGTYLKPAAKPAPRTNVALGGNRARVAPRSTSVAKSTHTRAAGSKPVASVQREPQQPSNAAAQAPLDPFASEAEGDPFATEVKTDTQQQEQAPPSPQRITHTHQHDERDTDSFADAHAAAGSAVENVPLSSAPVADADAGDDYGDDGFE